ncbi:hypothetical protein GC167_02980 [bacterium]|nr:hypothetical protein [bacterium]
MKFETSGGLGLKRWTRGLLMAIGPAIALAVIVHQWGSSDAESGIQNIGDPVWLWPQLILGPVVFGLEVWLWHICLHSFGLHREIRFVARNTAVYGFYQLFLPAPASEYTARLWPFAPGERGRAAQGLFGLQAIKWQARIGLGGICTLGIGLFLELSWVVGVLGLAALCTSLGLGWIIDRGRRHPLPRWIPERWFPERTWPEIPHGSLLGISILKGLLYALSFALFLKSMGGCAPLWIDWGAATAQYTLASLIPSWGWTEGLVLGGAGVLAFDVLDCPAPAVLQASLFCWLLHTALPGALGSLWAGQALRWLGPK